METVPATSQNVKIPRFEAYMMTGDLILNISKPPPSGDLLNTHAKKLETNANTSNRTIPRPRDFHAPRATGESTPTSLESPPTTEAASLPTPKQSTKSKIPKSSKQRNILYDKSNGERQTSKKMAMQYSDEDSNGKENVLKQKQENEHCSQSDYCGSTASKTKYVTNETKITIFHSPRPRQQKD